VEDVTHTYDDIPGVITVLRADQGEFDVDFIVYDTDDQARELHRQIRSELEENRGRSRSYSDVNIANFNRFQQTTDGRFEALVRVENTVVIILTSAENRDAARDVLDVLGY